MISIYLHGHDYEYEVRNVYKIFDLNSDISVLYDDNINLTNSELVVYSELINNQDNYSCKTILYKNTKPIDEDLIYSCDIKLEKDDFKKLKKTIVKKALYHVLSRYFNETAEYGFLTGIRPNKILTIALKSGMSKREVGLILKDTYEVSDEKIKLLNDIYDKQEKYMCDEDNSHNYNLYIHVPFCPSKCTYCSFVSYSKYNQAVLDEYVQTLLIEIEESIKLAIDNNLKLNTIYFGGGTPSVLSCKNINDIFNTISKFYDLSSINEITFEAGRPDTITEEMLKCLKNNYVGRISINPQTMNQLTLNKISRNHTTKDIENVYNLAREIGFDSINMDLIIGLPGETSLDVEKSIMNIVKLKPDNITVHALAYKKGSKLLSESKVLSKDTDNIEKMYQITKDVCSNHGYLPYYMYRQKNIKGNLENVGYAFEGKESIYNIVIIEEIETILACGAGAVSKILKGNNRHERVQNYKELKDYNINVKKNIKEKYDILNG